MELPQPVSSKGLSFRNYRRRRVIWTFLTVTAVCTFLFAPSSFWDFRRDREAEMGTEGVHDIHVPHISDSPELSVKDDELQNLLHMVATSQLRIPGDVDPAKPLGHEVYSADLGDAKWLKGLESDPPLIVFSKTYCPFSKKAKELLNALDISPPPKVIEVDLRSDADALKIILTRLTGHATFPNILIAGRSVGGFDDLEGLHSRNELVSLLQRAGLDVEGGKDDHKA